MEYEILLVLLLFTAWKWAVAAHERKVYLDAYAKAQERLFRQEGAAVPSLFRAAAYGKPARFDPEFLERLIRLCHPDKHGGSKLANEVTQQLLSMRE
jgi:hypothetical protein